MLFSWEELICKMSCKSEHVVVSTFPLAWNGRWRLVNLDSNQRLFMAYELWRVLCVLDINAILLHSPHLKFFLLNFHDVWTWCLILRDVWTFFILIWFQLHLLCFIAVLSTAHADISFLSNGNSIDDQNGYIYPKPSIPFELPSVSYFI